LIYVALNKILRIAPNQSQSLPCYDSSPPALGAW